MRKAPLHPIISHSIFAPNLFEPPGIFIEQLNAGTRNLFFYLGSAVNGLPLSLARFSLIFLCCLIFSKADAFNVTAVSVSSSQTGTLTYGTAGSVTYTVTLNMSGSGGGATNFSLNWVTPAGVTFSPGSVALTGDPQTITLTLNTTSATPAGNYAFTVTSNDGTTFTSSTANFVVDKKPLSITADNQSKPYGTTLTNGSGFTAFTASGLENGEAIGSATLAFGTGAAANASVATYTGSVTPSAATGGTFNPANYSITYVTGNIIVNPAPLAITADNTNKFYGMVLTGGVGFTDFTSVGLQNGESIASVSIVYGTGAAATASVGTYTGSVTPSAATGGTFTPANYSITYVAGNIIVNPAGLTITAINVTKPYGSTLLGGPGSTIFITSPAMLPNGETIGSVTIAYGTGAAANATVGTYNGSVTPSAAIGPFFNAANYSITYTAGDITVTNTNSTISVVSNLNPACTGSNVTLTATITSILPNATGTVNFLDGGTSLGIVNVVSNQAAISLTTLAVGSRSITAVYSGDASYAASTSPALIQTINGNPSASIAGTNQTGSATCGLTTVTLDANAPAVGTGAWSIATGTGGSFANASNPASTFSGVAGNSYTLRWTVSNTPCLATTSDVLVTFNVIPTVNQPSNLSPVCANSPTTAVNFSGTGTSYTWTNTQPTIGLAGNGTGNIASFTGINVGTTDIIATIGVTPIANGCTGLEKTFTITIKPRPVVTASLSGQTICSGTNISAITLSSNMGGINTYSWTRDNVSGITGGAGLAPFSGTGNSITGSFTSTLTTQGAVGLHATATNNGCSSASQTDFAVTVNPVATVNSIASQAVCNGANTTGVNFTSSNATSFTWTNNNTSIGLGAGPTTGNIAAFAGTNSGTSPTSGTITVTPVYTNMLSCPGTPGNFMITVNPALALTSSATPPAICGGTVFNYTPTTTSSVVTPSFTWTRAAVAGISNAAVANGSGDISETLVNTTSPSSTVNVTYVFTVWATHNGVSCANPTTFNVVVPVNPKPRVRFDPSSTPQNICTGSAITPVSISQHASTSAIIIDHFGWVRNTNQISFPNNGSGSGPTLTISGILSHGETNVRTTIFKIFSVSNQGCTSDTVPFTVNVSPPITNNIIQPAHVSQVAICGLLKQVTIAAPSRFTAPPLQGGNSPNYTYQWQESLDNVTFTNVTAANVVDGTLPTLIYQGADAFSNYYFRRIVNSGGCSDISPSYLIGPVSGAAPSYIVGACTGSSGMDIWVIASYAGATYQLERSNSAIGPWSNVSGATATGDGDSLNLATAVTTLGFYRVWASLTGPPACNVLVDGIVNIDPNTLPNRNNIVTSADFTTICSGSSVNVFADYLSAPAGSNPGVTWYTVSSGGTGSGVVLVGDPYNVIPVPPPVIVPDTVINYYAKAIYTTTGCKSNLRQSIAITVRKTPVMTSADSVGACSGSPVNLTFANNYGAGVTYEWKALADNPNVTGESLSPITNGTLTNTLVNTSNTTQTVQYGVTPRVTSTSCTGIPDTVKVTVDPRPLITPQSATVCSGTRFTIGPTNGGGNTIPVSPVTQYTWSVPTGTGFTGGTAGSGASITDSLINTTTNSVTAIYTVTPSGGACTGTAFTATVTLNPAPAIVNQAVAVCTGSFSMPSVTPFTGTNIIPAGTTYTWPAPVGTNISGMAASGGAQPNVFGASLVNTAPSIPRTATYTVTPVGPAGMGGCTGNNFTVIATIHPVPTATISGNATVCQGAVSPVITFTGANGIAPYSFGYNLFDGVTNTIGSSAGSISVSTTMPGTYTYTLLSVTDAGTPGCQVPQTGSVVVTVNPLPVIPTQNIRSCSGSLFSVTPSNNPPAVIVPSGTTYSWPVPVLPFGVTGGSAGTAQPGFSQTLINNTGTVQTIVYTVTPSAATCPGGSFTVSVTLDPAVAANTAIWTGSSNQDWCNTSNWACGILPDINRNAIVPSGTSNSPQVNCVNAYVKDLDVKAGASLVIPVNQELNIYGAIINTDPSRYTLNGTVNFAGSTPQTIPGFTYNGLTVSGGGSKILGGNVLVNGSLLLIDGIVTSTPANMLTIGAAATVSSVVTDASFINGPLTRLTNTTNPYSFPVGGGGEVRFATVTPASTTNSSYTVYYHSSNPGGTVLGADLFAYQTNEYWEITRNSGADALPAFFYQNPNALPAGALNGDWSGGQNPCAFCNVAVVEKNNLNNWYYSGDGTAIGFSPTQSTYWQSNGFVNSRVPIGAIGTHQYTFGYGYAIILPVTLVEFTGTLQDKNNALLKWRFAAGNDLASTELQHSNDGRSFTQLVTRPATTNSNVYNYTHQNLQPGAHYYRLFIKDKAGKTSYSKTVLLVVGNHITVIRGLRPTLVRSETFVDIYAAKTQLFNATLFDIAGRTMAQYRGNLQEGENSYRIPASLLAHGLYTLQVKTADGVMANLRFMKE